MAKKAKIYKDPVVITVYGETKTYERKDAIRFFREGMLACEGSEQDRYCEITFDLQEGYKYIDNDRGVKRMSI